MKQDLVGFIGLGLMGRPMALNLLKAGHRVQVWCRRRESMQPLLEADSLPVMRSMVAEAKLYTDFLRPRDWAHEAASPLWL